MTSAKPIVIDACTVLAWAFGEEVHAHKVEALLDFLSTGTAVVPTIFPIEVIGGLVVGQRKGRITEQDVDTFLDQLDLLPITIDDEPLNVQACAFCILPLCKDHGLRAKDALYLELARRLDLKLATFDDELSRAAQEYDRAFFSKWTGGPSRI